MQVLTLTVKNILRKHSRNMLIKMFFKNMLTKSDYLSFRKYDDMYIQ